MSKKVTLRFDSEVYHALNLAAIQEEKTIPNFIEFVLIHHLAKLSCVSDKEMKGIFNDTKITMSIRNGICDVDKGNYSIIS